MKQCPTCREEYDDDLKYCTYDGAVLRGRAGRPTGAPSRPSGPTKVYSSANANVRERSYNGWKIAFFVLLVAVLAGNGSFLFFYVLQPVGRTREPEQPPPPAAQKEAVAAIPVAVPATATSPSITEMSRESLLDILPKNLLRRFHAGETTQGRPDDLRTIKGETGEFVVLVGAGRREGSSASPDERILVLKSDGDEFKDVTAQSLPRSLSDGIVSGRRADARFDETGPGLWLRELASSKSVVNECADCDHSYQEVRLEWKGSRYVESSRAWENEAYAVFYATADAIEKRRVDGRARPVIDRSLDPIINQGFARAGKTGWTVEWQNGDNAELAEFLLSNGTDRLQIRLAKLKGQWRAVEIKSD
jgi:hypothetical protein